MIWKQPRHLLWFINFTAAFKATLGNLQVNPYTAIFHFDINFEFKTWHFKFQGAPGLGGKNGFPVYKTRDIIEDCAFLNPFSASSSLYYLQSFHFSFNWLWKPYGLIFRYILNFVL